MSKTPALDLPGTEHCGGCAGVAASTPRTIDNRQGLPTVSYRIGDHAAFRASLLAGLSSSQLPPLAALRSRDSDDWTIALLDAVAMSADVLSFYQQRIANESWLRTATERLSLAEMGRLIGYRLRPGIAAETTLAFAVETPPTPPPTLAPEPGAFITGLPSKIRLATGIAVQSLPGPDEKPQTFETLEAIEARPQWNAARPWLSMPLLPARGHRSAWLQGVATGLKVGDPVVFAGDEFLANPAGNNNWDLRLVETVSIDSARGCTRIGWSRGLGSYQPPSNPSAKARVYALRRRAGLFGHNAPDLRTMPASVRAALSYGNNESAAQYADFFIKPAWVTASGGRIDLDSLIAEIQTDSLLALSHGLFGAAEDEGGDRYIELYKVRGQQEVSRADFLLTGKISRIDLAGQNLSQFQYRLRETRVYAASEELPLAETPVVDAVAGDQLPLAVPPDGLEAGRRLIVTGEAGNGSGRIVHDARIVSVAGHALGCLLEITPPLPTALRRDSVVVHLNVARASHGETVTELLGAGDGSQRGQRFELRRLPLTWLAAPTAQGAAPAITLRVGDIAWQPLPTLYGAAPEARVYTLDIDERGRQWAVFGDGLRGARLPSGVNNLRASYRQGLGREGNVRAEQLSLLKSRPLGLKSVSNPLPASGGSDPEAAAQARRAMPLGVRTLGRAVSLLDYEDFALAFPGIAKAQAQVLQLAGGPTITITLAGDDGAVIAPGNPLWTNLWQALRDSGDPQVRVRLLGYQASSFRLGLKLKRDPAYALDSLLAAVEARLRARFSFEARALGQPVLRSEVIAAAHEVPGVVAIDLDFLYGGSEPPAQTLPGLRNRLLASRPRVVAGAARPAELLSLHPGPLVRLEEMP